VNGISGETQIAEMWKETFQNLYSMHNNENMIETLADCTTDNKHDNYVQCH